MNCTWTIEVIKCRKMQGSRISPFDIFISKWPSPGWIRRSCKSGLSWTTLCDSRYGNPSQPTMDHCLLCGMSSSAFSDSSTDFTAAKEHGFTDIGFPIFISGISLFMCSKNEYMSIFDLEFSLNLVFLSFFNIMDITSSDDESPGRCCWKIICNLFWMKLSRRDLNNTSEWLIKLKTAVEKSQIFILYNQCLGEKAWLICKFVIGLGKNVPQLLYSSK